MVKKQESQNWREGNMESNIPELTELKKLTNRELILVLVEKLRFISINQTNHLAHHWAITVICVSAGIIGLANLCIAMLVLFFGGK